MANEVKWGEDKKSPDENVNFEFNGWIKLVVRNMIIVIDDPAEDFSAMDRTSGFQSFIGDRKALSDPLLGASNIVVAIDEIEQDTFLVKCIQDKDVVQTFIPNRANPTFGKSISIGCRVGGCE